jgi:hypothetical protein
LNRRVRRALAILIAVLASAVLAACGDSTPGHTPVTPASNFSSPEDGIAFRAPKGATVDKGKAEQVAVLRRGESTVVITRFPRPGENLPNSEKEYERAARALGDEYSRLDGAQDSVNAARSTRAEIAGRDAAVVDVSANNKSTEHVHFYEYASEIVIDMVAPAGDVKKARFTLFDPVLATLTITKPQN